MAKNMYQKREERKNKKLSNNEDELKKTVINWYPGHMVKAQKEMKEKLKLVDIIFELLDARLPLSSANPEISGLINGKPRLILLNKASMADDSQTKKWINYFKKKNINAIAIDAISGDNVQYIIKETKVILADKILKNEKKGFQRTSLRAMILGIPNVGKSTLINKIAKRGAAKTGDRPGITKAQQWIRVNDELELLDTPGILWPKFDNPDVAYKLAVSGAIRDDILPIDEVAIYCMKFMDKYYHSFFVERYSLVNYNMEEIVTVFEEIGKKRGCLLGNEIDYERVSRLVLNDFRTLKIGRMTLDYYEEY